ncbi:MAG: hypothetical protein RB292_03700 [Patescibacteria group bacterium]|jgi:hypothetical protein|nr:hypothetical protein [Patescibacteria group bacterium]
MEEPFQSPKTETKRFQRFGPWQFWAVGGVLLFCLIILVVWSLNRYYYLTADRLAELAPLDSIFYVQANPNTFWQDRQINLGQSPYFELLQKYSDSGSERLEWYRQILAFSNQAALAVFPLNDQLATAYLFFLDSGNRIDSKVIADNLCLLFDDRIMVCADSSSALEQIKEVADGKIFSLAQAKLNFDRPLAPINAYLNHRRLIDYLNQVGSKSNYIYRQLLGSDIYFSSAIKNDQWCLEIFSKGLNNIKTTQTLAIAVPEDFQVFIPGLNLPELFFNVASLDPVMISSFNQLTQISQSAYGLSLGQLLNDSFGESADLLIFSQANTSTVGFNYLVVARLDDSDDPKNLRKLINVWLSWKLPQQSVYELPDGSLVTELFAVPQELVWHFDGQVDYLSVPELDFNIAYAVSDQKLLFASSRELLGHYLNATSSVTVSDIASRCHLSSLAMLIKDAGNLPGLRTWLPAGSIALGSLNRDRVEGCFLDF